jgi:hypothetical protein
MDDKNHGKMAEKCLGQKTRCSSKAYRMLVLDVFKGNVRENMKTVTSNLNTEEQNLL